MNGLRKQTGMSMLAILMIVIVFVFIATCAMKTIPNYITYFELSGVLERTAEDSSLKSKNKTDINEIIYKKLTVNGIRLETNNKKQPPFRIIKKKGVRKIVLDYSVEEEFYSNEYSNIGLVLHFSNEFPMASN